VHAMFRVDHPHLSYLNHPGITEGTSKDVLYTVKMCRIISRSTSSYMTCVLKKVICDWGP
jgi:hypothetical protein